MSLSIYYGSMAAMLRNAVAVVVVIVVVMRTRPRAIPLAMVHMRKSIYGFPSVPLYGYGAPPELRYHMCNAVWADLRGLQSFQYKWESIQYTSQVDLIQTELNSIQTGVVSFSRKSKLEEISYASHMTAIDRKNVIPEGKKIMFVRRSQNFFSQLNKHQR